MPDLAPDLRLTRIWQHATWGAGHLGDAIHALKEESSRDITKDLGDALVLLTKATDEIEAILAVRK